MGAFYLDDIGDGRRNGVVHIIKNRLPLAKGQQPFEQDFA